MAKFDVYGIGNALVDIQAQVEEVQAKAADAVDVEA